MEDHLKCRTTSSDTPNVSEYQNVSDKTFQYSYAIEDTTKFTTYKTGKKLVLSGMDQGLFDGSLHGKVEDYEITKDKRATFLDINSYQYGQFSEKTICNTTV